MTRTFDLDWINGAYGIRGRVERGGEVEDRWEKMLCWEFVQQITGIGEVPDKIRVTASDDPIESYRDKVEILFIRRVGYYRWDWAWDNGKMIIKGIAGMYKGVEEILQDFFPDAREDGLDEWKRIWIRIEIC